MSRTKIQRSTPAPSTYHLAEQLSAVTTDTLYSATGGRRRLAPIDGHVVNVLVTAHPWGYSAQGRAVDAHGHLQAAAEAHAPHPLPSGITSRIRTFQSGPLTWHCAAGRITDVGTDPTSHVVYVATGRHHYELRRRLEYAAQLREYWDLNIDGQPHPYPFAGPVGAADFVVEEYESS
jgi:hypothetical protein